MWLKPQGYACITDPDSGVRECSTMTCGHCNKITHVRAGTDPADIGGLCKMCMGLICSSCVDTGICDPFERKLEREEARYHARRYMEEAGWR